MRLRATHSHTRHCQGHCLTVSSFANAFRHAQHRATGIGESALSVLESLALTRTYGFTYVRPNGPNLKTAGAA